MNAKDGNNAANERPAYEPGAAEMAQRCRRLAKSAYDRTTNEMLDRMAEDYERQARTGDSQRS